jgi:4-methylaminobutanoate oxidase (formaldehyde-forming)
MSTQLPSHANVVIIGGGIVGCSVAYHLTKIGWTDVLLLERKELGSGTTWAAAGLLAQLKQNQEMTKLAGYSLKLYEELEAETGVATGFRKNGSLVVCQTEDRRNESLRAAAMARAFGVEMHEISLAEAKNLVPGMSTDDLVAGFYIPDDSITNPIETTRSLAKGAKMHGAGILENVTVTDIKLEKGAVCGVLTNLGDVSCEYVVNCAGMWGRQVGQLVNVSVPLHAAEHMHAVTMPIEGLKKHFPTVRDFDGVT